MFTLSPNLTKLNVFSRRRSATHQTECFLSQAFSHFTFERSGHQLIVVDIQGVGDLYTDPQIHTADGLEYGEGNLGPRGMALFFHSHICNSICEKMELTPFDLSTSEMRSCREFINKQVRDHPPHLPGVLGVGEVELRPYASFYHVLHLVFELRA